MKYKNIAFAFLFLITLTAQDSFARLIEYTDEEDIPAWAASSIEAVTDKNIMTGFGDGSFQPQTTLNRAEAVTLLLRLKDIDSSEYTGETNFPDVRYDEWFSQAVDAAVQNDWVKGFPDGTFRPADTLNRAQWAVMLHRAFPFDETYGVVDYIDVPEDAWFTEAVKALSAHDMFRQRGMKLFPEQEISRAEAAWQIAVLLGETRLMGDIKESAYDSKRVAIKPRDFNANLQGYDIQRNEFLVTGVDVTPKEESDMVILSQDSDWISAGELQIKNYYDGRSYLDTVTFRLRTEDNGVGPIENFDIKLENPEDGSMIELPFGTTGKVFWLIDETLETEEILSYQISIKPIQRARFYSKEGEFDLSVTEVTGRALKDISDPNAKNSAIEINARVNIEQTKLLTFKLKP